MTERCLVFAAVVATACGPSAGGDADASGDGTSTSSVGEVGSAETAASPSPTGSITTAAVEDSTSGAPLGTSGTGSSGDTGQDVSCESPWPNATMIACAGWPDGGVLATSGTSVFYESEGAIYSVDVSSRGGPTMLVADAGDVAWLLAVESQLYWASFLDDEVGRLDLVAGSAETFGGVTRPSSLAVDDDALYVTEYASDGGVLRIDLRRWTAQAVYEGLDHPGRMIVDGEAMLFADSTNNGNVPTPIMRGSTDGDPMATVHSDTGIVQAMVAEGAALYVARYRVAGSSIERTTLDTPSSTEVMANLGRHPIAIALTSERVFWTELDVGGENVGALRSLAKRGGEVIDHIEHNDTLRGVAVTDGEVVVFRTRDGVARLDE